MMKFVWRGLVVLGCGAVLLTGCRKPVLDTGYRVQHAPAPRGTGDVIEMPPIKSADLGDGGWTGTGERLTTPAGERGTIVPIKQRWADVVIYFAYDSAAIGPAERPKIDTLGKHLLEHPTYSVVVEGHCDERGSDEYNRALGECRALVVRDYLISLGVEGSRLETISYGEERPVEVNAEGEGGHQKNRRAEFVIGIRQ